MPLAGAAIGEYIAQRDLRRAGKVGIATWIGLLLGTAAKVAIVFAMIGIFVFALLRVVCETRRRSSSRRSHAPHPPHLPQRSRRPAAAGQARHRDQRRVRADSARRDARARQRDGDARRHAPRARPRHVAARIPRLRRRHRDRTARDERGLRRWPATSAARSCWRTQRRRIPSSRGRSLGAADFIFDVQGHFVDPKTG